MPISAPRRRARRQDLLIVGLGRIGARLPRLAKAFDMKVVATRRNPDRGADGADAVFGHDRLREVLPQADIVALTYADARDGEPDRRRGVGTEEADGAPDHRRSALISALQEGRIAAALESRASSRLRATRRSNLVNQVV